MKGLSLDGGGVFGIGQANILAQANTDKFDFFVGTSIGSAIAASLAFGSPPGILPKFFHEWMPRIFTGYKWKNWHFWSARYSDKYLNSALQNLLKGVYGNVPKPLFIVSADLGCQSLKVFHSDDPSDGTWPLWQVVRASVAAETYFPPWKGFGDGGIYANNPAMVGVAAASKVLGCPIEEIELASIGTGSATAEHFTTPTKKWSVIRWGLWLVEALLNGGANGMHAYFVRSLPLKKYERIDFVRESGWRMDSPNDMLKAETAWQSTITDGINKINSF